MLPLNETLVKIGEICQYDTKIKISMKMENQYKSEAELYVLANTLEKAEGGEI